MASYQYLPLCIKKQESRLITLLPGAFSDELRISTTHHAFTEIEKPGYEALSYVWGAPQDPATITTLPGHGHQGLRRGVLKIMRNLETAPQYLRYTKKKKEPFGWMRFV